MQGHNIYKVLQDHFADCPGIVSVTMAKTAPDQEMYQCLVVITRVALGSINPTYMKRLAAFRIWLMDNTKTIGIGIHIAAEDRVCTMRPEAVNATRQVTGSTGQVSDGSRGSTAGDTETGAERVHTNSGPDARDGDRRDSQVEGPSASAPPVNITSGHTSSKRTRR